MVARDPRLSYQTLRVLKMFLENPTVSWSGTEIRKLTGLQSGTLYPILIRLEETGWLDSYWEDADPRKLGRPRRRFYRITASGIRAAGHALKQISWREAPSLT